MDADAVPAVQTSASGPGRTGFVLVGSSDVAGSIGRDRFLSARLSASRSDAPEAHVSTLPAVRFDVLAQQLTVDRPSEIRVADGLDEWWERMFTPPGLDANTAVLVVSVAGGLTDRVWRHRELGHLVQPPADFEETWAADQVSWLSELFEPQGLSDVAIAEALDSIAGAAAGAGVETLVYNVSTYTPEEKVYRFTAGAPEPRALTAQRLNLALDRLGGASALYVLDVDRIVAERGAADSVTAPGSYTDETLVAIAEEAADAIAALPGVSPAFGADAMRLTIPRFDRRTDAATLVEWHVSAPSDIEPGQHLFDVRFHNLQTRLDGRAERASDRSLFLSVLATQEGHLREISVPAGAEVRVGSMVGVVVKDEGVQPGDMSDASSFPVGVRAPGRD